MTHDTLDDLLERSAPATRGAPPTDMSAMVREAAHAATAARRRTLGLRAAAGVAALALVGGGTSIAAAAGLFTWQGWAEDADIAYAFGLPSGKQCETRITIDASTSSGDGLQTPSPLGAALHEWARTADWAAIVDVDAQLARLDPATGVDRTELTKSSQAGASSDVMIVLGVDGHLDVVPRTEAGPTPDDLRAHAVDSAIQAAIDREASVLAASIDGQGDWATNLDTQCTPLR